MNGIPKELLLSVGGALLCAFAVSFLMCPLVKSFAYKIGAIDVPKDNRRMHKKPVPRLGGLAIFLGFIVSMLLFVKVDHQLQGILLGASIIVVLGVVDDMSPLRAYFKFCVQIFAALVAVFHGVVIQTLSNPNVFAESPYWDLGWLSIPITVLWIVGITNAVNLIDGLDGLACGVSTISAISMLVIALLVSESDVALVMAALVGACLGFMPYNKNPAKMFMGDTGSTFLGYILATISIQGLFKYYAIVSFAVPFLILGLPMFDTLFAIIRRLAEKHGLEMEVIHANDYSETVDIHGEAFRQVEQVIGETFPGLPVSPYVMTGATDAQFYQEICSNCLRFAPVIYGPEQMKGMHGIDENIEYNCLPGAVDFYKNLIRAQER